MLDLIKVNRSLLIYIIIISIFLSINYWYYGFFIGLTNLFFSIIFSIISFYIILIIFNFVGSKWYGLYIEFSTIYAEKEIKKFDIIKKQVLSNKFRFDVSYILTLIISIITFSYIVPIILGIKPIVIESKRIGKSRSLEPSISEINRIIFFSFILLWIFFSIIKYLSLTQFPIFEGFVYYFFRFLIFFTFFSIIPWNIILSGILSIKFNYTFKSISIGDRLFLSNNKTLISTIISIILLPILSLIFNPIITIILIFIIYSIIWLRLFSKEVLG